MEKVLFGGTFDPVHIGHEEAVRILSRRYEKVIVVPAAVSPFKSGTHVRDEHRLAMLKLALCDIPHAEVSRREIDQGGVSYTADTLRAFPDCDFAVGGDSMRTLSTWTRADEIRANTRISVIGRVGADCTDAIERWNAAGGHAEVIGNAPEACSAVARLQLALERHSALVDPKVEEYVVSHGLYLDWEDVKALYVRFHLKERRIRHSYGVAYTALGLAQRYGADERITIRAALLHDIAKYVTAEELDVLGVRADPGVGRKPESLRHAYYGAAIAEQILHEPYEIVQAIRWHTTGRAAMTLIEKIVCLADYIEPHRDFFGVNKIRELAEIGLDGAVAEMLKNTLAHLRSTGVRIDPETEEAYRYYYKEELNA